MTDSTLRFGIALAVVFGAVGTAAAGQPSDQTPDVRIEAGKVQQTIVRLSDSGTPIERLWVDREVSYADLDLTTTSGLAEFTRRVTEAAKEGCAQVQAADPADLSDMDPASCVRTATEGALRQAKATIDQQGKRTLRFSPPK